MPFHRTQLGRFGDIGAALTSQLDPDHRAAHLYASNGTTIGPRPTLSQILASKGFLDASHPAWVAWQAIFGGHRNQYIGNGGGPLLARCTASWPGAPTGTCLHELTPPLLHGNLCWFANRVGGQADNVITRPNNSLAVDQSSRPLWNFVVTNPGDILVASEDFELIKHTCVAGGLDVWSAGQVGIQNGTIRITDLQSGHYVKPNVAPGGSLAQNLIAFTRSVFVDYTRAFSLTCLHPQFDCVWG